MLAFQSKTLGICCATAGWAFCFGLGSQAVSQWLDHEQRSNTTIGLCHSAYYLGLAAASLLVPRCVRRWGTGCAAWGMIGSGVTLAVFPWGGGVAGYLALRLVHGAAGALSIIPLETWISRETAPGQRARSFACYGLALTLGGAGGMWAGLHFFWAGQTIPFLFGGAVAVFAGGCLSRGHWDTIGQSGRAPSNGELPSGNNFLSYGTAWTQGFLEGGLLAFLALYLESLGLSTGAAGGLLALCMAGVIILLVPLSWLADRLGRVPVLVLCYGVVAAMLFVVPRMEATIGLAAGLFSLGAFAGAMYPLGLALLAERVPEAKRARAYAWYLAVECIGSQLGAAVMGQARDLWGQSAMFAVGLAAVIGVLICWMIVHTVHRRGETSVINSPSKESKQCAAA